MNFTLLFVFTEKSGCRRFSPYSWEWLTQDRKLKLGPGSRAGSEQALLPIMHWTGEGKGTTGSCYGWSPSKVGTPELGGAVGSLGEQGAQFLEDVQVPRAGLTEVRGNFRNGSGHAQLVQVFQDLT